MPGLNGWQLAQSLREIGQLDARIIMLSASAMEEHRNALAAPFHDAFVMKPVDIDVLIETIADLLNLVPPDKDLESNANGVAPAGCRLDGPPAAVGDRCPDRPGRDRVHPGSA